MKVTIHQAICGDKNQAWGLLRTTLTDSVIAKNIAFKTDLQDSPPSGIAWLPAIRGFLFNDYFLIIKTYPDNSPNVRNGRVFSHCLIIQKSDLFKIADLSILFEYFKREIDKSIQLEPIILSNCEEKIAVKDSLQLRFNRVIRILAGLANTSGILIWVGQTDFEIAVCKLWQLLSQIQKENFNFGISFNPNEVAKDKLSFMAIPENAETKFGNRGFHIVGKEDSIVLTELYERFLAGEQNAIARIESFVVAIEAEQPSPKEVSIIAKGIQTFENIEKIEDLKLLNTLSSIIAKFSPHHLQGIAVKERIVDRISTLIEKADEKEIYILRDFPLKSFKESERHFSISINKWCSDFLLSEKQNQNRNFVPFIKQILDSPISNYLVKLVREKLSTFLSELTEAKAKTIWKWLESDIGVLDKIAFGLDNSSEAEKFLFESFQKAENFVLSAMKLFASKRGWCKLYAKILNSQFDFENAIKEQLKIDSNENYFGGIEIIVKDRDPKDVISVAVSNGDARCISLSGKLCYADPKLLENLLIENIHWQGIWLTAINNGNKASEGLNEPQKIIHRFFDCIVNGTPVNESLIEKISETDYGNILNYSNRNIIWSKLPEKSRNNFLEKTAGALLESLSKNSNYKVPVDTELYEYIIANGIAHFLYYNRSNIKSALPIFAAYAQLPEHIIKEYINNYAGKLDAIDATQLGKLVLARNYRNIASIILQKAMLDKGFQIALIECVTLLDWLQRVVAWGLEKVSKVEVSDDDWWTAFTQLSYSLYSGGPSENRIWTQADGKEYDLNTMGTGKEIWIAALQKLRQKGCAGGITVNKLLKAMLDEHSKNNELKTLKDLWKK